MPYLKQTERGFTQISLMEGLLFILLQCNTLNRVTVNFRLKLYEV